MRPQDFDNDEFVDESGVYYHFLTSHAMAYEPGI